MISVSLNGDNITFTNDENKQRFYLLQTDEDAIVVDLTDIDSLQKAMEFKSKNIKAKGDPVIFENVADCIELLKSQRDDFDKRYKELKKRFDVLEEKYSKISAIVKAEEKPTSNKNNNNSDRNNNEEDGFTFNVYRLGGIQDVQDLASFLTSPHEDADSSAKG